MQVLFLRHPDGDWIVGWGPMDRRSSPPAERLAFYLPDFFMTDPEPWWVPERSGRLNRKDLVSFFPDLDAPDAQAVARQWQDPDRQLFDSEFEQILATIRSGKLNKAVPVVLARSEGVPSKEECFQFWRKTLDVPTRWMAYGGWNETEGLIGLSPEILFNTQPGWTEVMALAGTAEEPGPSLLQSPKDMREHLFVANDIRDQLENFGPVKATPTREWKLGRLKHLRTDLAIEQEIPFQSLVEALHPTPALGVSPRGSGLEILKRHSSAVHRRRFGAPFGVHVPGEFSLCCVAIRGLQWHEGSTWLATGCGVVDGSEVEKEWQELSLKRQVVREQFGI